MNYLFYDIQISGHHTEYINHILEYVLGLYTPKNHYYFVVHQNFKTTHNYISYKAEHRKNITFIEVEYNKVVDLNVKNRLKRSFNNFNVVGYYAKKFKIDFCYLLHINVFQLAIGFKKTKYKVRGILFMQFTNMKVSSIKDYYFYLRRYLPLLVSMKNKNLDAVFILNDKQSCIQLNKRFKKNSTFKYLPDPIPNNILDESYSIKEEYTISKNKKIFLHFGSLSHRKGVLEIIDSVNFINKEVKENIAILIVGKCAESSLEKELLQKINYFNKKEKVQIIWENDFVSEAKMNNLFNLSDYILMPYKNPEASSGILGHAMKAKKPVIGPSSGLIGAIIKEYKMGYGLEKITPKAIAEGINQYNRIVCNTEVLDAFLKEHTPYQFAKTLLCH